MTTELKYVPVLKWKQGEQKAVEGLQIPTKQSMTPLIEIPQIDWDYENDCPKKTIDEHLSKTGESLYNSWGITEPVFIDLIYIDPSERMQDGSHPLSYVLQEGRNRGINLIPVTDPNRDSAYQLEVMKANQTDQNGVCIRLKEAHFNNLQHHINQLLQQQNISPNEVDLVIDYEYASTENKNRTSIFLKGVLDTIPYLHDWRSLTLTGTSFPADLGSIDSNSIGEIERSEWLIWKDVVTTHSLKRSLNFGDYGISNPAPFEADPRFINMSANIRYTADDKYIIFKGRVIKRFGGAQYFQIAQQVVAHHEYYGAGFSAGDYYINEVANNNDGPGNATSWRKAGTNHHLTLVITELSNWISPSTSSSLHPVTP
ncbi:beta family protein [Paenibacillus sp. AN1007]|uniref:Beta family protein n=1 Tax=Paenibacillus sp. AN1007 TaxID=3151385 RepID=A0AAU8NE14_9BACL